MSFNYEPSVEVLQALVAEPLYKQDILAKALRIWVILTTLYGEEANSLKLSLATNFLYSEWHKAFYKESEFHPNNDSKILPQIHDPKCPCSNTITDWLFRKSDFPIDESKWRDDFKSLKKGKKLGDDELNQLLHPERKVSIDRKTEYDTDRPLGCNRKSLYNIFSKDLVDMGFLEKIGKQYRKVTILPKLFEENTSFPSQISTEIIGNSIPNLISWEDFFQTIEGEQRFFVDLENIISLKLLSNHVEKLNHQLKSIWSRDPVLPIKLIYRSAKQYQEEFECIVYPVCFYYIKRAPYLFAYGTTPNDKSEINWYDYRVDRIIELEELNWESREIPSELSNRYKYKTLPTPQEVQEGIESAFGYDFYQPQSFSILRFDPYFHDNYIKNTERDNLFQTISFQSVQNKIKQALEKDENLKIDKQLLLSRILKHKKSIYCQVNYYLNDNNVLMRLRSWSPNVEVILPWKLRQRMKEDIEKSWKLYESD